MLKQTDIDSQSSLFRTCRQDSKYAYRTKQCNIRRSISCNVIINYVFVGDVKNALLGDQLRIEQDFGDNVQNYTS